MVGARLRELRLSRQWSLSEVAGKAEISASTLSRIETNKQELDLALFLLLSKILGADPATILDEGNGHADDESPLATRIASLDARGRAALWRDLAATRRSSATKKVRRNAPPLAQHIDELLAQLEFLREQIDAVRTSMPRRR